MAEKKIYRLRENAALTGCVQPEYEAAQFDGAAESVSNRFPDAKVRVHKEGESVWVDYRADMFLVSRGDYVVDCVASDRVLVLSEDTFIETFEEVVPHGSLSE